MSLLPMQAKATLGIWITAMNHLPGSTGLHFLTPRSRSDGAEASITILDPSLWLLHCRKLDICLNDSLLHL